MTGKYGKQVPDASLIAAAPELLAVLETMAETLRCRQAPLRALRDGCTCRACEVARLALTVMLKAKGVHA